jgi:glycosyltransferase involved in cell wall biosynthesis
MRIIALVKGRDHVCCRYRIAPFCSHLEGLGHTVEIVPWSSRWLLGQMLPFRRRSDAIIVQRKLFTGWRLSLLRRQARFLIYDFDDAVFLNSSYNPAGANSPKRWQQFQQMVRSADLVFAGNDYLRAKAATATAAAKVRVIPTCVNVHAYPIAQHRERKAVKLAWIGSASTLRGLHKVRDLLDSLGQALPRLQLKLICDRSLTLCHLPIEFCPWSEATEAGDLADADIGISWLPDDDWSAGKCGLKIVQYLAAGLPVVANPVGVHPAMLRDCGLLATTPSEWLAALARLVSDVDLRRRLGATARRRALAEYDVATGAAAWASAIASLDVASRAA